jgi:2-oxoglutarate-dependent dioxygenase
MQPGDCVAFSRLTVHGSGSNHTSAPRVAYAVQYHREDVKATWDGNGWMALTQRPRWSFGPVERLSVPATSGDG